MSPWTRSPLALALALLLAGAGCDKNGGTPPKNPTGPEVGAQLFNSPQVNAIVHAEGPPGKPGWILVANTTSGTVSVFRAEKLPGDPLDGLLAEIRVGVDPVGIAVRPRDDDDDPFFALVTNHISDSISVIDLERLGVVQTLQAFDASGVTTTDAPTGVVFAGPDRAFVALDDRDEVLVIDFDAGHHASLNAERLPITAQAPRAMTVVGNRLLVGSFESGNQTEFPNCDPLEHDPSFVPDPLIHNPTGTPRGFSPGDPWDEGCQFYNRFLDDIFLQIIPVLQIDVDFGVIVDFAAQNPNVGGEVIIDRDRPDRDVFVFDADALGAPVEILEGVSTLLYGLASSGPRVWVTSADGRNALDGLADLDNRMFENRLSYFDCSPDCGPVTHVDLDQNPFGVPVPTPYGVAPSGNGQYLVVSVAGSDGIPGLAGNPGVSIPGLVTLDAYGNVLGHVQTGAIPQSVALVSDAAGNPDMAWVLNTVDSTVTTVKVSDPAHPKVYATVTVGDDPTPDQIRLGRTMFMSARASTKGTFSCESCHPNGNTDQLIWTINTVEAPQDYVEGCDPFTLACPEPRTTMPLRGLRDTLPLHWVGNLADPFPNPEVEEGEQGPLFQPEDDGAPDCDIEADGEAACVRHLVNASLSGVMCDQTGGCAVGPSGLPGALTDEERNAMAAALLAISYPPSPTRRPDDALSPTAIQGVTDFFTDEDGLGVGSQASAVGAAVGFAPITCADNSGGCHALPLGVGTNSITVGNFDAPTMRGLWDRHVQFSNGNPSSEEVLVASQRCADGLMEGVRHPIVDNLVFGDPCALESGALELFIGASLNPFSGQPSGETIYHYEDGITERGVFLSTFETLFSLAYGTRGAAEWELFSEMGVGFSGLYGRQVGIGPDVVTPADEDALDELVDAAKDGKVTLVASYVGLPERRYDPDGDLWRPAAGNAPGLTTADLLQPVVDVGEIVTVTAHLKGGVSIGGADRQPLLDIDPAEKAAEEVGTLLAIPRPSPAGGDTFRLGAKYVDPAAQVLVNGAVCPSCSFVAGADALGAYIDLTLALPLPEGTHVLQVLNPDGWISNEMPIVVTAPAP